MPNENQADLFEADGVTPKVAAKSAPTEGEIKALERAARAEGEAAALKTVVTAKPPEKPAAAEKVWTRAELRAKVNAGEITEDAMDDTLERQLVAKLDKRVSDTVESRVASSQVGTKVSGDIARYVEAFPAINQDGSALRAKIEAEFQDLVKGGASESALSTELAAIKIVCGSLTKEGRKPEVEGHQDIGGGGDGDDKPEVGGAFKGLTQRQKSHYEKMIARGVYSGPKDKMLVKELARIRGAH